jgi:RNA polymerase sigma factor (sigma-70 family)
MVVLRDRMGVVAASNAEIYRKHADEITRFATGLVGPSDASDVVSEAVLRCIGSAQWAGVTERGAYLFRAVFNEAARFHRSNRRRKLREERIANPEGVDSPEIRPDVVAAVDQLSLRQRAVVILTYWDDLAPSAIAQLLQISEGSVRRHLARGKSRLKEVLRAGD